MHQDMTLSERKIISAISKEISLASYNTLCPKIDKGAELRLEDRHVIKIRDKLGSDSGIRDRYALDGK